MNSETYYLIFFIYFAWFCSSIKTKQNVFSFFLSINLYLRLIGTFKGHTASSNNKPVFRGPRGGVYYYTDGGNKRSLNAVQQKMSVNFFEDI